MSKISVIITVFDNQDTISACLESVFKQNIPVFVSVIDNASSDETVSIVQKRFKQVSLIRNKQNIGFSATNNQGINRALSAGSDYILILNPDTKLFPFTIKSLLSAAQRSSNLGIYGPKIYSNTKRKILWSCGGELDPKRWTAKLIGYGMHDEKQYNESRITDFISGTCMLIPRKVFGRGLRFYEPYFMYYEDVEFCQMAKRAGFGSIYVPEAAILHTETSAKTEFTTAKQYYLARNHLLFVGRSASIRVKLREFMRLPKTVWDHYSSGNMPAVAGLGDYLLGHYGRYDTKKTGSETKTKTYHSN